MRRAVQSLGLIGLVGEGKKTGRMSTEKASGVCVCVCVCVCVHAHDCIGASFHTKLQIPFQAGKDNSPPTACRHTNLLYMATNKVPADNYHACIPDEMRCHRGVSQYHQTEHYLEWAFQKDDWTTHTAIIKIFVAIIQGFLGRKVSISGRFSMYAFMLV